GLREQCPICANAAPLWRRGIRPSTSGDRRDVMLTLRTLAIVIAGAGMFAGLPLTPAQACDDDRYPCPIRVPQEVDAPAQAAPSAQPQKKASHAARQSAARPSERAQAKRETPPAAARAKPSKPAAPEQAADSIAQKAAEAPPAPVPSPPADQPLNAASRGESPVAAAGTAWPVLPTTEGAGAGAPGTAPAAMSADATEAAKTTAVTTAVQVVDANEVNDLDRAAASVQADSSWLTYLLLMLATALAAASAFWFFARRAAPRVRMSNS